MRIPKRGERGFTLVELLIVLAILAVLAAVVIPNITGMFGRGAEQALDTDRRTAQTAVATCYFDIHKYHDTNGWNDATGLDGHYYPTEDGKMAHDSGGNTYDLAGLLTVANGVATPATFFDGGVNGAIWMGLLVNTPGVAQADNPDTTEDESTPNTAYGAYPLTGEKGPYLQEFPKSSSRNNGNTVEPGTYTWVVVKEAKVYALYFDNDDTWKEGSSGTYP